nr:hypothetical protein [Tanacetum cinerariifolium]
MKSSTKNAKTSNVKILSNEEEVFHESFESFQEESSSSSLNDDVQQSSEEVRVSSSNTQSVLNNMVPNVDEASTSHNTFNECLEDAYFVEIPTPMVEQAKLKLDLVGKLVDHTNYQSMIGSLMYVTLSRPDIMFATCLWYPKDSGFDLTGYSDADHAGCHLDRKSDLPFWDNSPPLDILTDHFELFSEFNDDCTSSDADSFEDIEYVVASPPDSELTQRRDKTIFSSPSPFPISVEDSDSFFEKFDTSLSYSDNSSPEFETFSDHTEETSSGSTTTHADNSLSEYDSFLFEIEPDQGEFSRVVMEAILGEPRVYVPNPTLYQDSDFSFSDDSLKYDLEISFPSGTRNKIFDPGIFLEIQSKRFLSRDIFSPTYDCLRFRSLSCSWFCPSSTRASIFSIWESDILAIPLVDWTCIAKNSQDQMRGEQTMIEWLRLEVAESPGGLEENSSNAIAPDLPTEEPDNSLSMGDEHLRTILETKLNKIIKSSVENLVPIPSESEGISDDTSDVPFWDNSPPLDILTDHFEIFSEFNDDCTSSDDDSFEDIEYVEASPLDSELVSLEEVQDDILCEKLLNINLLISKIESLNDNSTPDCVLKSPSPFPISVEDSDSFFEKSDNSLSYSDNSSPEFDTFSDHTEETSSGSTTTHVDNSLPEYDLFLFEIELDQGELSRVVMEAILGELRAYVPNPTLYQDLDFSSSDDSLRFDLEISFPFGTRNKIFNSGIFLEIQSKRFLSQDTFSPTYVSLPFEDYLTFTYVIRIFLPYFTYPVESPFLLSSESEDIIFDPGISVFHFSSLESVAFKSIPLVDWTCKAKNGQDQIREEQTMIEWLGLEVREHLGGLEAFMKAFGKAPNIVVTDQDEAMRNAIEAEFGGSKHRLCMWHITQKLPAKICAKIYDETDFKEKLNKI